MLQKSNDFFLIYNRTYIYIVVVGTEMASSYKWLSINVMNLHPRTQKKSCFVFAVYTETESRRYRNYLSCTLNSKLHHAHSLVHECNHTMFELRVRIALDNNKKRQLKL